MKSLALFKPMGWFYRPVSIAGWVITLIVGAVFVHDFQFVNAHSHSVSDLYYNFLPYGFIYLAALNWIASKTTATTKNLD